MYEFGMLLKQKIWEDEKFAFSELQKKTNPQLDERS
jgi:hypothetical protein